MTVGLGVNPAVRADDTVIGHVFPLMYNVGVVAVIFRTIWFQVPVANGRLYAQYKAGPGPYISIKTLPVVFVNNVLIHPEVPYPNQ